MPRTNKPTLCTSNNAMSLTEICAPVKKHSAAASESLSPTVRRTRFLLWSNSDRAWLADHQLVDDGSQLLCHDVNDALGFSSYEAALERARYLMASLPGIDSARSAWNAIPPLIPTDGV